MNCKIIYLGLTNRCVFFSQLISCFDSEEAHAAAMADLQHRILPPAFLSENPKEAGFLLWLLHPESSSRPTARFCSTLSESLLFEKID